MEDIDWTIEELKEAARRPWKIIFYEDGSPPTVERVGLARARLWLNKYSMNPIAERRRERAFNELMARRI